MAVALSALLNIKANVTGQGAVQGLNNAIGGIKGAAGAATGGLQNLTKAAGMGGLAGAMGALAPLLSVAGLVGMAKASISAGAAIYDMSKRTGVSVEQLAKFKKAAGMTGTSLETVERGFIALQRSMAAAAASNVGQRTKKQVDEMVKAVEDGEKRQTTAIEREADRRANAVDRETDGRLRAINKRYQQEAQKIKDALEDQAATGESAEARNERMRDRQRRDALDNQMDALEQRKQAEIDAIKSSAEQQKTIIKDGATFQVETIKTAAQESIKALKLDPGETAMAEELEDLGLNGGKAAEAFRKLQISVTDATGKLRDPNAVMLELGNKLKAMPEGPEKMAIAMALLKKSGTELLPMLNMGGDAIDGMKVKMTTDFATAAKAYSKDLTALGGKIGGIGADIAITLLPVLTKMTDVLIGFFDWLNKQDPIIKNLIGTLGLAAIAFTALAPSIAAVISIVGPLIGFLAGGAGIAGALATVAGWLGATSTALATVAGWLGAVVPFFTGLATAVAAFITWPVVLVAALVAAGVAIFVFRDQIGAFFSSVGELVQTLMKTIWDMGEPIRKFWAGLWEGVMKVTAPFFEWLTKTAGAAFAWLFDTFYKVFAEPYIKAWKGLQAVGAVLIQGLRTGWAAFSGWIGGIFRAIGDTFRRFVVDPLTKAWRFIVDTGKAAMKGLLSFAVGMVNGVISAINTAISAINVVRKASGQSTLDRMKLLSVPRFAEGGFVTGPTLAMVGDNPGGREYVIPEGKAAGFAANYLGGARGAAAIPTTSSGATGGAPAGPVQVNLTTGPIMQTADGQRSVSLEEVERLVRDGVGQTIRQLRTPAGRYAMGVR